MRRLVIPGLRFARTWARGSQPVGPSHDWGRTEVRHRLIPSHPNAQPLTPAPLPQGARGEACGRTQCGAKGKELEKEKRPSELLPKAARVSLNLSDQTTRLHCLVGVDRFARNDRRRLNLVGLDRFGRGDRRIYCLAGLGRFGRSDRRIYCLAGADRLGRRDRRINQSRRPNMLERVLG